MSNANIIAASPVVLPATAAHPVSSANATVKPKRKKATNKTNRLHGIPLCRRRKAKRARVSGRAAAAASADKVDDDHKAANTGTKSADASDDDQDNDGNDGNDGFHAASAGESKQEKKVEKEGKSSDTPTMPIRLKAEFLGKTGVTDVWQSAYKQLQQDRKADEAKLKTIEELNSQLQQDLRASNQKLKTVQTQLEGFAETVQCNMCVLKGSADPLPLQRVPLIQICPDSPNTHFLCRSCYIGVLSPKMVECFHQDITEDSGILHWTSDDFRHIPIMVKGDADFTTFQSILGQFKCPFDSTPYKPRAAPSVVYNFHFPHEELVTTQTCDGCRAHYLYCSEEARKMNIALSAEDELGHSMAMSKKRNLRDQATHVTLMCPHLSFPCFLDPMACTQPFYPRRRILLYEAVDAHLEVCTALVTCGGKNGCTKRIPVKEMIDKKAVHEHQDLTEFKKQLSFVKNRINFTDNLPYAESLRVLSSVEVLFNLIKTRYQADQARIIDRANRANLAAEAKAEVAREEALAAGLPPIGATAAPGGPGGIPVAAGDSAGILSMSNLHVPAQIEADEQFARSLAARDDGYNELRLNSPYDPVYYNLA